MTLQINPAIVEVAKEHTTYVKEYTANKEKEAEAELKANGINPLSEEYFEFMFRVNQQCALDLAPPFSNEYLSGWAYDFISSVEYYLWDCECEKETPSQEGFMRNNLCHKQTIKILEDKFEQLFVTKC